MASRQHNAKTASGAFAGAFELTEPLVRTVDLAKHYPMGGQAVHALRGVTVAIGQGEFVAVMGPSGSGKSTFLNLVGCLDRPTAGRYLLEGTDVSGMSDDDLSAIRNRKIGFVFQTFNLLARTPAVENVGLPLLYSNVSGAERRRRALEVLDTVGLGHRRDHLPSQLSGGEQQRVAAARALVNQPLMILADEPTGSLDTRSSLDIMAMFQDLNRTGMTIVVVTHNAEIAHHAKRIISFRDGRVIDDSRVDSPVDAGAMLNALPADGQDAAGSSTGPMS